jgi:hypothetical protein
MSEAAVQVPAFRFPTGLLLNTATGRYHPITFRYAPMPGGDPEKVGRYKSAGHHTAGFALKEEALAFVAAHPAMRLVENEWEWDGMDIPAMVWWFAEGEYEAKDLILEMAEMRAGSRQVDDRTASGHLCPDDAANRPPRRPLLARDV